jgi:signal transduction histidine kinase
VISGNVAVASPVPAPLRRGATDRQLVEAAMTATVGELASGVAHEVNNPLFAILGLVELLLGEAEPGTQVHSRLAMIRESGAQIRDVLRALSEFAHDREDGPAATRLERSARSAVELVRRTTAHKDVEIVERFLAEPVLVDGSPSRLRQVFVSLIANAQQAMARGGMITVEVSRAGRSAVATVADTGPGIAPDVLPHIFEPFFTTRGGKGGTGLGLAAALAIARSHGGELSVESALGTGTRFTLRLPLSQSCP